MSTTKKTAAPDEGGNRMAEKRFIHTIDKNGRNVKRGPCSTRHRYHSVDEWIAAVTAIGGEA